MKPLIAAALAGLVLASCTMTGAVDLPRIEADVKAACKVWTVVKDAAVVAGILVPGVSSAAVVIDGFVDPVCDGSAVSALSDPATATWIKDNTDRLHALLARVRA